MTDDKQRLKELADFLKTRRARLTPTEVGLPNGSRRRTPGLRREEVAQLALKRVVNSFEVAPAYITGYQFDVLQMAPIPIKRFSFSERV
jgi:hypothetical protein